MSFRGEILNRIEYRMGGGPEIRAKIPYFGLFRNQILAFFVTGHENCGDFASEILMITVALLANLRASQAARTASSFTFRARVSLKPT